MPEPVTLLGVLALNIGCGIASDAAQVLGRKGYDGVAALLGKGSLPENHNILRATHAAHVTAMAAMAKACATLADSDVEKAAAKALKQLTREKAFRDFRFDGEHFPLDEANAAIDRMFAGGLGSIEGGGPAAEHRAYNRVIVADLATWGIDLPPLFDTLFVEGVEGHLPWHLAFRTCFADALDKDSSALNIFTIERLTELRGLGIVVIDAMDCLHRDMRAGFSVVREDSAELKAMMAEILGRRRDEIDDARIDPKAIYRIASTMDGDVANPKHAFSEIKVARGSNLDDEVEVALRQIDERAAARDFDAAAAAAERAFAQWENREANRRELELQIGIRFAEENIRANRLRRDAEAVAIWIRRKFRLEMDDEVAGLAAAREELTTLIEGGRDRGTNLDLEVAASLAQALQRVTESPEDRASAMVWRGTALAILGARREGTEALDEAVVAYRAALEVYTRDRLPLDWAMTQNNLGNVLQKLGERLAGTEALDAAVDAHHAALEVYTRDRLPLDWAMTQNNLGNVLQTLGKRRAGTEALDAAVDAYRAALEIYTRDRLPLDWATTQNNLGNVLQLLGAHREGTEALDAAVSAFRAALEVQTRDSLPLDWAMTQNNLGTVLAALGARLESTETLDEAVTAFCLALEVRTHDDLPLDWAMTMENIGYALMAKAAALHDELIAGEAVVAFEQALEVYAHPALEWNRGKAANGLGRAQALRDALSG